METLDPVKEPYRSLIDPFTETPGASRQGLERLRARTSSRHPECKNPEPSTPHEAQYPFGFRVLGFRVYQDPPSTL